MWPYPWMHVGTPSHPGHLDLVAATLPFQAPAGPTQGAPDLGQWEGQGIPLVRSSSCIVKGGSLSSRRYLPTYLDLHALRVVHTLHGDERQLQLNVGARCGKKEVVADVLVDMGANMRLVRKGLFLDETLKPSQRGREGPGAPEGCQW